MVDEIPDEKLDEVIEADFKEKYPKSERVEKKIHGPVGGTQYCNDPEMRVVKKLVKWNPGKNIIQVPFKRITYDGQDFVYRFQTNYNDKGTNFKLCRHEVLMDTGPNDCMIGYYKEFDLYVFCPFGGE